MEPRRDERGDGDKRSWAFGGGAGAVGAVNLLRAVAP